MRYKKFGGRRGYKKGYKKGGSYKYGVRGRGKSKRLGKYFNSRGGIRL